MFLHTMLSRAKGLRIFQNRWWSIALAIIGAVCLLAPAGLLIWYASIVNVDIPFIDDWKFIALLKKFVDGQIGWLYFFEPHNGHPMMLDRVAFYFDLKLASLNMALLRWCTVIVMLATAALLCGRLYIDLQSQKTPKRWAHGETILLLFPACALALSLSQWEYLMVAASVDLAAASFFLLLSVFLLDCWCSTRRALTLIAASISAVLASMTQMQGIITWPAMALLLILDARLRANLAALFMVLLAFVVFVGITWMHLPSRPSFAANPIALLVGNTIVIGNSYLGHVNNRPLISGDIVFGSSICILTAMAVMLYFRSSANLRKTMNKYMALIAFGIATSVVIEIGRLHYSREYLAASRYGGYVMPWAWGLYGVVVLGIKSSRLGAFSAFANIAIIVIGVGISDFEENRIAIYRNESYQNQKQALCNGKILSNKEALRKTFYVGEQFESLISPMRNYLLSNKLSFFRDAAQWRCDLFASDSVAVKQNQRWGAKIGGKN
jgi:hypothetical protein